MAAALVLFNTVLGWFRPDLSETLGMINGLPMLLNELFLGVWLIVKGFNPVATPVGNAHTTGNLSNLEDQQAVWMDSKRRYR